MRRREPHRFLAAEKRSDHCVVLTHVRLRTSVKGLDPDGRSQLGGCSCCKFRGRTRSTASYHHERVAASPEELGGYAFRAMGRCE